MDNSKNKDQGLPKDLHDMIMEVGDEVMKELKEEIAQRSGKSGKPKKKKK